MKRPTKPPYRIPTMREIARVPFNGRRVVSLFSGCGGSSLDVVFVNEIPHTATGKILKTALRDQFKDYTLPTAVAAAE